MRLDNQRGICDYEMKQTYLEKTATVHSNWLGVEECIFCLGSRGRRLVAFRDIRDDPTLKILMSECHKGLVWDHFFFCFI